MHVLMALVDNELGVEHNNRTERRLNARAAVENGIDRARKGCTLNKKC